MINLKKLMNNHVHMFVLMQFVTVYVSSVGQNKPHDGDANRAVILQPGAVANNYILFYMFGYRVCYR